jgi:hypothetical protein
MIANELELKSKMTNASLLVHEASSIQRFVLPLLSKGGQSSGLTKSNSLIVVDIDVSILENIT